jgi:hypothetical protein
MGLKNDYFVQSSNFKIPAYRQAGKCQMNVKVQNQILKRVQNDTLVMPNLFRHHI